MSKYVPFVVHVRVVPERPGKRFEYVRSLQKLGVLAHDAIKGIANVTVAEPGGGQHQEMGNMDTRGGLGGHAAGTAVKPQIGQSPAQLMLAGFYTSANKNVQEYAEQRRISGGTNYDGPGDHPWDAMPVASYNTDVKTLKDAIHDALEIAFPAGTIFSIFRIDFAGIVYGDRGFHFPQS